MGNFKEQEGVKIGAGRGQGSRGEEKRRKKWKMKERGKGEACDGERVELALWEEGSGGKTQTFELRTP